MATHFNASQYRELAVRKHMKVRYRRAPPGRDEEMTIAAEEDVIRVVIGRQALHYLARCTIDDRHAIANVLSHINEFPVRCYCNARGITRACSVARLLLGKHKFVGKCRSAIPPRVDKDRIG